MSVKNNSCTLELPADLATFAQAQVDAGAYGSVVEVVRDAFGLLKNHTGKLDALREELDVGIAQLDVGESKRATVRELMDEIRADIGLARKP